MLEREEEGEEGKKIGQERGKRTKNRGNKLKEEVGRGYQYSFTSNADEGDQIAERGVGKGKKDFKMWW